MEWRSPPGNSVVIEKSVSFAFLKACTFLEVPLFLTVATKWIASFSVTVQSVPFEMRIESFSLDLNTSRVKSASGTFAKSFLETWYRK